MLPADGPMPGEDAAEPLHRKSAAQGLRPRSQFALSGPTQQYPTRAKRRLKTVYLLSIFHRATPRPTASTPASLQICLLCCKAAVFALPPMQPPQLQVVKITS